ncbi:MAG TPA: PASTA domain-containing protein, partial [Actinomycetota bacterium]|nr:PASTA domain-containing protein [Actinomycetota bacterium]
GFRVKVVYSASDQRPGTVIAQDPAAGQRALQTSTVTITVAEREEPSTPTVPNVTGMTEGAATSTLRAAGFEVSVQHEPQCDEADPACDYQKGIVWAQTPAAGTTAEAGSTVTILVNP